MKLELRPNEKIVKIFRRYGLIYFWHWLLVFIFIVAPFFFMFVLFSWGSWGMIAFFSLLFMGLVILLRGLFFWRRTNLIITSERVINVEQKSLINQLVTDLAYQNIRNVIYQIKGVFPTVFRYGLVKIQTTSSTNQDLLFLGLKKPAQVANLISQTREDKIKVSSPLNPAFPEKNVEKLILEIPKLSPEELKTLKTAVEKRWQELL